MLVTVTNWLHCFLSERVLGLSVWSAEYYSYRLRFPVLMTMDNTVEPWYSCLNKDSNTQTYNQILQCSYACHGHSSTKEMKCVKGRLL